MGTKSNFLFWYCLASSLAPPILPVRRLAHTAVAVVAGAGGAGPGSRRPHPVAAPELSPSPSHTAATRRLARQDLDHCRRTLAVIWGCCCSSAGALWRDAWLTYRSAQQLVAPLRSHRDEPDAARRAQTELGQSGAEPGRSGPGVGTGGAHFALAAGGADLWPSGCRCAGVGGCRARGSGAGERRCGGAACPGAARRCSWMSARWQPRWGRSCRIGRPVCRRCRSRSTPCPSTRLHGLSGGQAAAAPAAAALAVAGAQLGPHLPWLLGMDAPRTYLVLVQNNDELRATGGFISAVGQLTVDQGKVTGLDFADSYKFYHEGGAYPWAPQPMQEYMQGLPHGVTGCQLVATFSHLSPHGTAFVRTRDRGAVDGVIAIDQTGSAPPACVRSSRWPVPAPIPRSPAQISRSRLSSSGISRCQLKGLTPAARQRQANPRTGGVSARISFLLSLPLPWRSCALAHLTMALRCAVGRLPCKTARSRCGSTIPQRRQSLARSWLGWRSATRARRRLPGCGRHQHGLQQGGRGHGAQLGLYGELALWHLTSLPRLC